MTNNEKIQESLQFIVDGLNAMDDVEVTRKPRLSARADTYIIHIKKNMAEGKQGAKVGFELPAIAEEDLEEGDANFILEELKRVISEIPFNGI